MSRLPTRRTIRSQKNADDRTHGRQAAPANLPYIHWTEFKPRANALGSVPVTRIILQRTRRRRSWGGSHRTRTRASPRLSPSLAVSGLWVECAVVRRQPAKISLCAVVSPAFAEVVVNFCRRWHAAHLRVLLPRVFLRRSFLSYA